MKNYLNFFAPKERRFFDMLAGQSTNITETANMLKEFLHKYNELTDHQRLVYVDKIHEMETKGDTITHNIINTLNKTFITPLDREDIFQLANYMDDILDYIDLCAKRLYLYKVQTSTRNMQELSNIIVRSAEHVHRCMSKLTKLSDIKHHYIAIQELENMADILHDKALAELFAGNPNRKSDKSDDCNDPITVIKLKDIYDFLEEVTDKCEAIAHVLEGIVVKHT